MTFKATGEDFWGACIDSRAQRTVIGQRKAHEYLRKVKNSSELKLNGTIVQINFTLEIRLTRVIACLICVCLWAKTL